MRRIATLLSAVLLAGALRPAMRHDCGQGLAACAPRAVVSACHGAPACHKNTAPVKRECPGMVCCISREARAAVAGLSVAPQVLDEGIAPSVRFSVNAPAVFRISSSPSPPGDLSRHTGFLASSSLRGPPALA